MQLQFIGLLAVALAAQAPAPVPAAVTLVPKFPPGATYAYAVTIHSAIGTRATLDTNAEINMRILPGATPGHFKAALRFTKYATTVQANDPADQSGLQAQSAATDHAAQTMTPVTFAVTPDTFQIESRPAGGEYDQPVEMLAQLARTDTLPLGPVTVGSNWTRVRSQPIPTMSASVALHMQCSLAEVGQQAGQPTASVHVVSIGDAQLPPGSLPGSDQLAAQGLLAEASIAFNTDATSIYRQADAVLLQTTSQTHNQMHIKLVGPSPDARVIDTTISSTSTLKLLPAGGH